MTKIKRTISDDVLKLTSDYTTSKSIYNSSSKKLDELYSRLFSKIEPQLRDIFCIGKKIKYMEQKPYFNVTSFGLEQRFILNNQVISVIPFTLDDWIFEFNPEIFIIHNRQLGIKLLIENFIDFITEKIKTAPYPINEKNIDKYLSEMVIVELKKLHLAG